MRHVLIVLFLLINSGCATFGLKMKILFVPTKLESLEHQRKFLVKHDLDTTNLYRIKETYLDSLGTENYTLSKDSTNSFSPVQFRIYDNTGDLHFGWYVCFGDLSYFLKNNLPLDSLKTRNIKALNGNPKLQNDLNFFDINKNEKELIWQKAKQSDYTVIYFWSAYLGKFTAEPAQVLENYLKKNSNGKKVNLMKLNISPL